MGGGEKLMSQKKGRNEISRIVFSLKSTVDVLGAGEMRIYAPPAATPTFDLCPRLVDLRKSAIHTRAKDSRRVFFKRFSLAVKKPYRRRALSVGFDRPLQANRRHRERRGLVDTASAARRRRRGGGGAGVAANA
ncbi:hypothetical protein EVAR_48775_1 [Eumeta japonica]|uniref:Uncharacterized protein n=1 Tax=Eumeta variegata TaxID=151549 RepID=A0A4C1Y1K6_EUMVA|nr:hypothetical protein EVAR_48775_1 [Eumeta japonica]